MLFASLFSQRMGACGVNRITSFSDFVCNLVRIYLLKVNNRNSRKRCEKYSKLTIKIPERHHWRRSGVFIVNFERISHLVLLFLMLTLNM